MKSRMIIFLVLGWAGIVAGEGDKPPVQDQSWVYGFEKQMELDLIWNGSSVMGKKQLLEKFQKGIGNYEGVKERYFYQGHLYKLEDLKKAAPSLFTAEKAAPGQGKKTTDTKNNTGQTHTVTFDEFLRAMYVKGLEADLKKGWIQPDSKCKKCLGTGKIPCGYCEGKGRFIKFEEVEVSLRDEIQNKNLAEIKRLEMQKRPIKNWRM